MGNSKPGLVLFCLLEKLGGNNSMGGRNKLMGRRGDKELTGVARIIALYFGFRNSWGLAISSLILPDFLDGEY